MWNQLWGQEEGTPADDDGASSGETGDDGAAAARSRMMPTSQPSPMATPAKPEPRQHRAQQAVSSTSRYADYLSEVADASDVVTPGKSPMILSAPTFEDGDAGADGGGGDSLLDGLNFDDVVASPGGGGGGGTDHINNHHASHSPSSSSSSSSEGAVTMDVASTSVPPFAAEFTAGFFPPGHIRSVPSGVGNASLVSGITDLASAMSSSSSRGGVENGGGSSSDDTSPGEEEEEILVSSSDNSNVDDSNEQAVVAAGAEAETEAAADTTPVPVQHQHIARTEPSSAPQRERGPLSPFSPDARRARTEIREDRQQKHPLASAPGQWSLLPCRKVSVLVRVKPPGAKWDGEKRGSGAGGGIDGDDEASPQLGIFPLLPPGVAASHAGGTDDDAPAIGLLSLASELSSSAATGASQAANSLVVVNPTAFGTRLPSDLTMETARLVAEVGHIDSEDWARRYRFDDILWPNGPEGNGGGTMSSSVGAGRSDGTLIAAARAMAGDALSGRSSVLCTLGSVGSGRPYAAFGRAGLRVALGKKRSRRTPPSLDESDRVAVLDRVGVLGLLVAELNDFSRMDHVDFTVSLLEVVDDDVLRDLFRAPNTEFDPGQPRLRHPDHFGAVVQNMTELTFGSVKEVEQALSEAAQHSVGPFASSMRRGHLIATIKVAVSSGRRNDTTIQIVDLNHGEEPDAEAAGSGASALDATQKRRSASVRKSLSGLRGVLRGLIVQEAQRSSYQTLSYRECTLTKLLQRSLDSIDSRAILVACVDPAKEAYHRSVQTLNYVNRLWIKPGITAQSPFEARVKGVESIQTSTARTLFPSAADATGTNEDGSDDGALLQKLRTSTDRSVLTSLVSDPRQRVATLLASSSKSDQRNSSEPEPVPTTPAPRAVKSSSSSRRRKVGGTFDNILAKLDALESTPTYEWSGDVDNIDKKNGSDHASASKASLEISESRSSASVSESMSESQATSNSDEGYFLARIEALQAEKAQLQLDVADERLQKEKLREEAKQASCSSGSQTGGSSEADLIAQIEELQSEKEQRSTHHNEEIKASDDALAKVKEELVFAKDHAKIAVDAKQLAEDKLGLIQNPSHSSENETESDEAGSSDLKERQIDQLKAEKKLMQRMALSMKQRLETEKEGLQRRLETVQEEADTAKYRQGIAENELEMMQVEHSSSTKSSEEGLQRENDVLREELKRLKDSSSESQTSSGEADLKAEVERLQRQVIQGSADNEDAMKLLKEELGEARYEKLVAVEEARLLRVDNVSGSSSSGGAANDTRLNAELTTARNALQEHKARSGREKEELEYDKSALQARLSAVINQDIRTSGDVIDSLREKLRESYDKAKAREDEREDQRGQMLERISDLNSALENAQYAEHIAKEEARVLKASSSSHTTSSSEAELAGQLRAAQESLVEHKRDSRQLEHDKKALKTRLAGLVGEVAVLQKQKSEASVRRSEEKVTADSVRDQKDIRIRQLLSEIEDMGEVKAMTDNELERVREMLVAATSSSGESAVSKSASIGSSNESALIAKIEQLQAEKRRLAAENFDAARIAREAVAAVKFELQKSFTDARSKVDERGAEIKDSDEALALMKDQLDEAFAKAREKAAQRLAEETESDDRIANLMTQVQEAVYAQKRAEDDLMKERRERSKSGSQSSSSDNSLLSHIESLQARQREQAAQSVEAARIADNAINAVRAELEQSYEDAKAKAIKRSAEMKDSDDALASMKEELDKAYSKAISKASEHEAEINASDDRLTDTKAQLAIAKEQARLAYDAKVLAEDEVHASKSSSSGSAAAALEDELRGRSSSSSSSGDALLLRQIDQLKAEKKLTQQMAVAMKKRLEGRNRELNQKLDTLQEEVEETKQKLSDERSGSSAETGSYVSDGSGREDQLQRDLNSLRAKKKYSDTMHQKLQDQVTDLEAQVKAAKTAKLLAEGELRRKPADSIASGETERKAVRALQRQLAESRVKEATAAEEKRAVERRLDEETEAKLKTEDKLEDLQKRIREKQLADRLSDTSSSSESNASDTEALRTRVRELEAERMLTMDNFRKLERKLADGQSSTSIGDEMNYLRNKQVQSLIQEIELLEKAVDSLTDENEELQKASVALEKDQNLHQRLLAENIAVSRGSDGSRSPQLEEQIEGLTSQIDVLKRQLAIASRGEEQSKAAEQSEREEVLSLQSRMDKTLMQLQTLKSSSRSKAAAKEEEIATLRSKLKQTEADNESLRSELASSDRPTMKSPYQSVTSIDELNQLRQSNEKLVAKIEELSKDLSFTKKSLIENQENTMDVMSQYESLRLTKEEDENLLRQSQAKVRELEQSIEISKRRNDIALSSSKKDAISAEDKLHKRIHVTEHAHAERVSLLERRLTQVHKEGEDLRAKNDDLVKQLAHEKHMRREQNIDAKKTAASLQEEVDTTNEELVTLHSQILALTDAKNKLEEKIGKKRDQISALKSEAKHFREELSRVAALENANLEDSRMRKRLESENSALRSSIKQCDEAMEAMRKEVLELKSAADEAVARLEAKKESSEMRLRQEIRFLEERLQERTPFAQEEMEKALRGTVGELEDQLHQTSQNLEGATLNYQDAEEKWQTLLRENDSLKQDLRMVEAELRRYQGRSSSVSFHNNDGEDRSLSLSEKLHREKSLRVKAEEIALNLAQRAKTGALDRHNVDSELGYLKTDDFVDSRTRALVATGWREGDADTSGEYPPYSSRHRQAIDEIDKLKPVVNNFQSLYEMKDQAVRELQSNLSLAKDEVEKYKQLSSRLQQRVDEAESLSRRGAHERWSTSAAATAPPRPDHGTPYRSRYTTRVDVEP